MARYWSAAKSRVGSLRNPPVLGLVLNNQLIKYLHIFLQFSPEPHILLFRRPLGTDPVSGKVDPELERQAKEEYLAGLAQSRK